MSTETRRSGRTGWQFQRYCRDLPGLCADALMAAAPPAYEPVLSRAFTWARKLDRQNAHSRTVDDDFGRFGFGLWEAVGSLGARFPARRRRLDQLNAWRNAVAHQDFRRLASDPLTVGTRADLSTVRCWRRALDQLAEGIDRAVHRTLTSIVGSTPW